MAVALITGVTGQDGQWLAKLLLEKGYQVHGTSRRMLSKKLVLASGQSVDMHQLEVDNSDAIAALVARLQPDEIYHLAARSSSSQLFDSPFSTASINGLSSLYFLEAIKKFSTSSKFCFASSSEVFAGVNVTPQSEQTPHAALNPYGIAKSLGMQWVNYYRLVHGIFACSAILYNHESINREIHYVTRKITSAAARIHLQKTQNLILGDLNSQRDWMHASDAVRGMWMMLQEEGPADYVLGSGVLNSVRDICQIAFSHLELDYKTYVVSQVDALRRTERVQLCADNRKALTRLRWQPEIRFATMIQEMVDFDVDRYSKE